MYINELYHYGVKGMKWGVRKKRYEISDAQNNFKAAKADYKMAKKQYNKSFNKANNRRAAVFSPSKKQRQRNDERWEKALNDADNLNRARAKYKTAKKERRNERRNEFNSGVKNASNGVKNASNEVKRILSDHSMNPLIVARELVGVYCAYNAVKLIGKGAVGTVAMGADFVQRVMKRH